MYMYMYMHAHVNRMNMLIAPCTKYVTLYMYMHAIVHYKREMHIPFSLDLLHGALTITDTNMLGISV